MMYFLAMITLFILYHLLLLFFPPNILQQDLKEPDHLPEINTPGKLLMLTGVFNLQAKGLQFSETHPSSLFP